MFNLNDAFEWRLLIIDKGIDHLLSQIKMYFGLSLRQISNNPTQLIYEITEPP